MGESLTPNLQEALAVRSYMEDVIRSVLAQQQAATTQLVTALPPADQAVNGQEVAYLAGNGVIWRFKFNSGSASSFKWEFIGGSPLFSEVVTSESTGNVGYVDLTTVGPELSIPLSGDYYVTIGANVNVNTAGGTSAMSYSIGATAASELDRLFTRSGSVNNDEYCTARPRRKDNLVASELLTAKYRVFSGGVAGGWKDRWMSLIPIRCS